MSREAVENTISEMRSVYDRSTDSRFAYYVNRADIKDWADTIEKNVAEVLAENARLRKKLDETEKALKPVLDEYIPDFSMCECCHEDCSSREAGGCEWYGIVEAARRTQSIIGGWSWTRISENPRESQML